MDVPQFIAGRFRIEGEIGRGGMGTVYRATHLGLQRSVAVKIIKSEYADDADVADRFMREARTMAKLRHRHAAMIFDAGNLPDGRHFIIMEFIEGVTLSEALAREARFSPERAVNIAIQVCEVLEEAHQLGIIHRDLKPANIMLNERGVCVLDFGVAKVLASSADATTSQASTGSGQIIGTPRYMSPEQCLGQRVGARSDLYSLGVVLYEMLAGRPPFIDPLPSVVLVKQATTPPPPLPRLREDIPRALALAVHTLLAKRSEDRPLTAAAARALLERSLVEPERHEPELDPLPATVAAAGTSRHALLRFAAPLILVSIMGALLLALGYGGPAAEMASPKDKPTVDLLARSSAAGLVSPGTTTDSHENGVPAKNPIPVPDVSLDQARSIVASHSHGSIGDVAVAQTVRGPAIVAIHDETKAGKTHFFTMERRGSSYRVTDRGALDTSDFHGKQWTVEKVNANGDNRNQLVFTGISAAKQPGLRLVLYDPGARADYSLNIETDSRTGRTRHMEWSDNIADSRVAAYRVVLREKAQAIIANGLHGK
ncbi:MAG: serine/threonine protein kinase [Acidobacteriota bacterium]|nr:serine/threonine protein kinase [Acidobacteriota bacterium]